MNRIRLLISMLCFASVLSFAFGIKSQVAKADVEPVAGECQCCAGKMCGMLCYGGVGCCEANCYIITAY
jgi:hypothetical protein